MQTPFLPSFEQLPATLPVFPLAGVLVMPGAQLPLNIFEPRYLNMVQDALASHHLIGMLQPDEQARDSANAIHRTGTAGRITAYSETPDGRIEIVLTGVCRFDIAEELACLRGYRLIKPDWRRFQQDFAPANSDETINQATIFPLLDDYLESIGLSLDSSQLHQLPFEQLINLLITQLPLPQKDKQAMIESLSFQARYRLLCHSLGLASGHDTHQQSH
jgi:uncharacterized protein